MTLLSRDHRTLSSGGRGTRRRRESLRRQLGRGIQGVGGVLSLAAAPAGRRTMEAVRRTMGAGRVMEVERPVMVEDRQVMVEDLRVSRVPAALHQAVAGMSLLGSAVPGEDRHPYLAAIEQ